MKLENFYTDDKIFTMLNFIVLKLCDFEVLKIDQNLHANMEGFRRASHKCPACSNYGCTNVYNVNIYLNLTPCSLYI